MKGEFPFFFLYSITGSPHLGQEKAPGGIFSPHLLQIHIFFVSSADQTFRVGVDFDTGFLTFVAVPVA